MTVIVKGVSTCCAQKIGRAIVAIRDNELATASLAIRTGRYIVLAFTLRIRRRASRRQPVRRADRPVIPESFGLIELILHFAMRAVGGLGSLFGSVLWRGRADRAAEFFRSFPVALRDVFGGLLIAFLLLQPAGSLRAGNAILAALRYRYYRTAEMAALLELTGISVHFAGLQALDEVAWRRAAAEIKAVIGPNGAGKTTLFNAIRVMSRSRGSIKLNGLAIHGLAPHAIAARGVRRHSRTAACS